MTLDEAIKHAEEVAEENEEIYEAHCRIYSKKVVEKYPSPPCKKCAEEHRQLAEWLKELKAYKEQSDDAISRQAVLKIIDGWYDNNRDTENIEDLIILITYMSSVTPQQRTGQWIEHFDESGKWYECDKCHTDWGGSVNYCPNCGAKMEVEE